MLFDEKEMLDICKKYGIDMVEKMGYPLYNEQEMDENFSLRNIMNDTHHENINEKTIYTEKIEIKLSIDFEDEDYINFSSNNLDKPCFIKTDHNEHNKSIKSSIANNKNISVAA